VLKGCYPSLHRSRLPPIFSLPFLLLCPVRWFLYVYWTHTFKKFVKLDKRWECKCEGNEKRREANIFSSIRTKRKKIFASSVVVPVSSCWNAHNITRFLFCVVVTIISRGLSVIYIYEYFIWYRTLAQYEQDNFS